MGESKFNQIVKSIRELAMIVAFGAGLGLFTLTKREQYFGWLAAELVPYFGIPLLTIFMISVIPGGYGVILLILEKWREVKELAKDVTELKKNRNGTDN